MVLGLSPAQSTGRLGFWFLPDCLGFTWSVVPGFSSHFQNYTFLLSLPFGFLQAWERQCLRHFQESLVSLPEVNYDIWNTFVIKKVYKNTDFKSQFFLVLKVILMSQPKCSHCLSTFQIFVIILCETKERYLFSSLMLFWFVVSTIIQLFAFLHPNSEILWMDSSFICKK